MALPAVYDQNAGLRAAAADLDAVAHHLLVGRLAEHAVIELFAAVGRPLQQLHGAVDRDVFLIAGDQERDRSLWLAVVAQIIEHGGDAAGDATLHVDGATAIEIAVLHVAGERALAPGGLVTRGHHVGVAGEHDVRRFGPDPRIEVVDICGAGLGEGHAVRLEAGVLEQAFEYTERPGIGRGHGRATDQVAGNGESIGHA